MANSGRRSARRWALGLSIVAAWWAIAVWWTDGFVIWIGPFHLSSRNPTVSSIIAIVGATTTWALAPAGQRGETIDADIRALAGRFPTSRRFATASAAFVSVATIALALAKGAFIAGGSDSYGYVSQADLWSHGVLRIDQPIMTEVTFPFSDRAWAPLGYRPAPDGAAIVPIYAPGLPLMMSLFQRLGGRDAVFLVVPLLGGLAVWCTYLMGCRLRGGRVGLSAAVLLASSPVFLFQLVQPMSDVPATAWWALALAFLLSDGRAAALGGGVAVGLALLTRPNLVFAAILPGVLLLWQAVRAGRWSGREAQRVWLFAAGVGPFCVAIAFLHSVWYGSPLANGYGANEALYSLANVVPNLARYPRWLVEAQSPLVLLGLIAPWLPDRGRPEGHGNRTTIAMWSGFIVAVFACYVSYVPFNVWWYLRFLLPAFPAMMILVATSLVAFADRLAGPYRIVATMAIVGLLAGRTAGYAVDHGLLRIKEGERKYVAVGSWIARRLPGRAVVITSMHSGSIRYYAGRLTLQWTWIPETGLDAVVEDLTQRGYVPYFLLEPGERNDFNGRFGGRSQFGELDWSPAATFRDASEVGIYDPRDRAAARRGDRIQTETID